MNRDDSEYLNYPSAPSEDYEGLWIESWSNGREKYRGHFRKNGERHGQHVAFAESGTILEISYWHDNKIVGMMSSFHEDGQRHECRYFGETGSRTGNHAWWSFNEDDEAMAFCVFEDFELKREFESHAARELNDELGIDQMMKSALRDLMSETKQIHEELDEEEWG